MKKNQVKYFLGSLLSARGDVSSKRVLGSLSLLLGFLGHVIVYLSPILGYPLASHEPLESANALLANGSVLLGLGLGDSLKRDK